MTRGELLRQAAETTFPIDTKTSLDEQSDMLLRQIGFKFGAKWADEHPQNLQLSSADRGIIDEIIFALNSLCKEKMISYHKEIEFLNKIRKL